ncbi:unnamed protein product [Rhodiola kirilowii]
MMMKIISGFPASLSPHPILFVIRHELAVCGSRSGMSLRCSKDRDYSSAFPMRYVPKKARQAGVEKEVFSVEDLGKKDTFGCYDSSMLKLEDVRGLNSARISNEKMQFENNTMGILLGDDDEDDDSTTKSGDTVGDFESPEKEEFVLNTPQENSRSKEDADKVAVKLLAARAYTALELKKKLIAKRFSVNTIDAVISDFRNRGLINDSLYAEAYSQSRWSSSTWGPRRIKQALFTKGINAADMEKAVNSVFQEGQCDDEEDSKLGLSKASMDHLYAQASKQWRRGQGVNIETRKSRIVRWLQYRGFNWNVVSFILKKLESL